MDHGKNTHSNGVDAEEDTVMIYRNEEEEPGRRGFLYLLTSLAAIGGFLFGYDTGVVSGAMILLKEEFDLDNTWQELIVAVAVGFAAIFALIGSPLNNIWGRKGVILLSSVIFALGSVLMAIAKDKVMLLVGRATVGAAIGLSSMTIPMYIAESSPPEIRGKLVTINVLFITGGQVIASCVDGLFSNDKENGWRFMLGLAAIPAAIQFVGFLFLPESPRWLIEKGKLNKAAQILKKILGNGLKVQHEMEALKRTYEEQKSVRFCRLFTETSVRRALFVGCGMQMFQQLVGINTVMYYSATIIQMSGVKDDTVVIWLAAGVASMNFFGTVIGIWLVERLGRRTLSLLSMAGVLFALLLLSLAFLLPAIHTPSVTLNSTAISQDTEGCFLHSTCESCMLDDKCGFCYMEFTNSTGVTESTCTPSADDPRFSLIGRCAEGNISTAGKYGPYFAQNYCPTKYSWLALIGMIFYLMCFAPGMGPMPWTVNSEIYPQWARSAGNAMSTGTNWVFNVLISLTFLHVSQMLTYQGAFLLYAGFAFLGFIFIFLFLPETKGKPLEEIEDLFSSRWIVCGSKSSESYRVILNGNDTSDNDDGEDTLFVR
uniref:proton myo-inositol cotransporter-like n=1 Tax=Styela clava TaxID=7725 RepID=UPI00193A8A12|nr:proton myo-inositol cotransporter-like [Styela clava]